MGQHANYKLAEKFPPW